MWEDVLSNFLGNIISAILIFIVAFYAKDPMKKFLGQFISDVQDEKEEADYIKKHYFKFGSKPNNEEQFDTFLEKGVVGIGWPDLGDLSKYIKPLNSSDNAKRDKAHQELKELFDSEKNAQNRGRFAGYFLRMLTIQPDTLIAVSPAGKTDLYIFQVTDGYSYDKSLANKHMAHTLKIDNKNYVHLDDYHNLKSLSYVKNNITDTKLNSFIRAINSQNTIISLEKYSKIIDLLWEHKDNKAH